MKKQQYIRIIILIAVIAVAFAAVLVCALDFNRSADVSQSAPAIQHTTSAEEDTFARSDYFDSLLNKMKSLKRESALHEVVRFLTSDPVTRSSGPQNARVTRTAQEPLTAQDEAQTLDESPTPLAGPENSDDNVADQASETGQEPESGEQAEADQQSGLEGDQSNASEEEQQSGSEADQQADTETTEEAAEEETEEEEPEDTEYGTPTGKQGFGNEWQNVIWTEFEDNGTYTIVCSVVDSSLGGKKNAMISLLDENGKNATSAKSTLQGRVSKIVMKKGITGIGWTYLNAASTSGNSYEPLWPNDASDSGAEYTIDKNKTDVFNGFKKLKTVVPCSTIRYIGWSAFRKCTSLSDFDFKKCPHLKEILNQAFNPCPALNTVDLSRCSELTTIGWAAFNGAATGSSVELKLPSGGSLAIIGGNSFKSFGINAPAFNVDFSGVAGSLTQIQLGAFTGSHIAGDLRCLDNLTMIGSQTFQNTNISGMQISPGITSLPSNAFSDCSSIKRLLWDSAACGSMNGNEFTSATGFELTIGGNVSKLPNNFFKAMRSAGDIYFEGVPGGHVISITSAATSGSTSPISNITRSCFVDEYGVVFELTGGNKARVVYCPPGITKYTVPAEINVPAVGSSSAHTCTVTAIAPSAFTKARDLHTVSFEDASAIKSVGDSAFYGVGTLTQVRNLGTDPVTEALTISKAKAIFTGVGDDNPVPDNAFDRTGLTNYVTVIYKVKAAKAIAGSTLDGSLPGTVGNAVIEDLSGSETITAEDLRSHYYRTTKGKRSIHFPYFTYVFRGWRTESGTLVLPGDTIQLDAVDGAGNPVYDADENGRINLTSEWTGTWKPGSDSTGTPSVNFSIWTNVSSANSSIDSDTHLPEQVVNYSPKISNAIMFALDGDKLVYPDELLSPSRGRKETDKYNMITYVGSSILEADQNIRKLADVGFTATDPRNGEVTWKLSSLPDDETVLRELAEMTESGEVNLKDENGVHITADQLTTDNFVVRWCCVKYQSGDADGWNVNAKLTRKTSYIAVTKTFSGDSDAASEAIDPKLTGKKAFNITLTSTTDPDKVLTLKMTNRVIRDDALSAAAIAHGKLDQNDQYGYIQVIRDSETNTDKYVWIVPCGEPDSFYVKENDYSVTMKGLSYGVIAQYNQLETGNPADAEIRQWTNRTQITTSSHPSDDIDIDHFETTNFLNEYVAKDLFIIENYDDGGVVMPEVAFAVFDENGKQLKLNTSGSSAQNQRYTVLLDEGRSADTALTGSDGIIRLTLPQRADGTHVYQIRQTIPDGYNGAGSEASFKVSVDAQGNFSVTDITGPDDFGSIDSLNSDAGNSYGAKVINTSQKMDVVVTKTWPDGLTPERSVELDLIRTAEDANRNASGNSTVDSMVLTSKDHWTKTIQNLPIMVGNRQVTYSLDETRIGDDEKGSAAFSDWTPTLTTKTTSETKKANEIDLNLRNDHAPDVTVSLHKIDSQSGHDLEGVTFRVFKETGSDNASNTVTFKGTDYEAAEPLEVTTDERGLAELTLRTSHTYYIEEYSAPDGYENLGVFLELTVDSAGGITAVSDTANASAVVCSPDNSSITVKDDLLEAPAPTNYVQILIPFLCIALAALVLLATARRRRRV